MNTQDNQVNVDGHTSHIASGHAQHARRASQPETPLTHTTAAIACTTIQFSDMVANYEPGTVQENQHDELLSSQLQTYEMEERIQHRIQACLLGFLQKWHDWQRVQNLTTNSNCNTRRMPTTAHEL